MTIYKCKFCDFETNKMSNMKVHINKKKFCDIRIKDKIHQYDILKLCFLCDEKYKNKKEHDKECNFKNSDITSLNKKIIELVDINNKVLLKLEEQQEKLKEQQDQIKDLKESSVININTQNITYNNININDYNLFTTSHISRNMIFDFFKERARSRNIQDLNPFMFEIIYCYENSPENHSIYIINSNNIFACKNKKFVKMTIEEVDLFCDDVLKGRIKYKIDEIFDKILVQII